MIHLSLKPAIHHDLILSAVSGIPWLKTGALPTAPSQFVNAKDVAVVPEFLDMGVGVGHRSFLKPRISRMVAVSFPAIRVIGGPFEFGCVGGEFGFIDRTDDGGSVTFDVGLYSLQRRERRVQSRELLLNLRHNAMLFCTSHSECWRSEGLFYWWRNNKRTV